MALVQNIQQLLIHVLPTGVQILPDGPAEKKGVLRNNGQPGPAEGTPSTHTKVSTFTSKATLKFELKHQTA